MYIDNAMGVLLCLFLVPLFAAIMRIPAPMLTPMIVLLSMIGAYAVNNSTFDIRLILLFGLVGYIFKKLDYPLAPLIVALVLGDMTEEALRQSLILSYGSIAIFFTRPIAAIFIGIAMFLFLFPSIAAMAAPAALAPHRSRRQRVQSKTMCRKKVNYLTKEVKVICPISYPKL